MLGLSTWGGFVLYATNKERASSSILRQLYTDLKNSNAVKATLGDGIRLEPKWWLGGEPRIEGAVSTIPDQLSILDHQFFPYHYID